MRYLVLTIALLELTFASAQDFPGYQNSRDAGVNAVFFNPAAIAGSRYKWDVNLFAVNVAMANERASFGLGSLGDAFKGNELSRQFLTSGRGVSTGVANATILGPSVMYRINDRSSVALSTRGRIMMTGKGVDGELINALLKEEEPGTAFPYGFEPGDDMKANFNGWTEYGLSYARILKDDGVHRLKAGVTLKYLSGIANGYLNIDGLQGTLDQDGPDRYVVRNATGRMELGFAGASLDQFDAGDLGSFSNTGVGADIGFVYEYRPGADDAATDDSYQWKAGISLLDIGSIRYKRDRERSAGYEVDISGAEELNLEELSNTSVDELRNYFDAHPQFFTSLGESDNNYTVTLPASLRVDLDYHISNGFYVAMDSRISLVDADSKIANSQYYSTWSLTPRYDGRVFGVYLPLQYNKIAAFNAGLALRAGPVFLGSGSLFNAAFGDSRKADFFIGVRFGGK